MGGIIFGLVRVCSSHGHRGIGLALLSTKIVCRSAGFQSIIQALGSKLLMYIRSSVREQGIVLTERA